MKYQAVALKDKEGKLENICLNFPDGKSWLLESRFKKKSSPLSSNKELGEPEILPIYLGSGSAETILEFLKAQGKASFPAVVVDRERPILEITSLPEALKDWPDVLLIESLDPQEALERIYELQKAYPNHSLRLIAHPAYTRLRPEYYGFIRKTLESGSGKKTGLSDRLSYPKFKNWPPKVLFMASEYFLTKEILSALKILGAPVRLLPINLQAKASEDFISSLLHTLVDYRPDMILTINHLGFDREGKLAELLNSYRIPLASWYVDNPRLILADYPGLAGPWTGIFTWDKTTIPYLKAKGFERVAHLPLGTDQNIFKPRKQQANSPWSSQITFVGDSMLGPVRRQKKILKKRPDLLAGYANSAKRLLQDRLTRHTLQSAENLDPASAPNLDDTWGDLTSAAGLVFKDPEEKLAYELLLTWEATRIYRNNCLSEILPFEPLIVGDEGWKKNLAKSSVWRWHKPVDYYAVLPEVYTQAKINFNATSIQMDAAVNQRVFDVPASASFLLTDYRSDLENFFRPGIEIICYKSLEEIKDLAQFYLSNSVARYEVIKAGYKRVLAEHTYVRRLTFLLEKMFNWGF